MQQVAFLNPVSGRYSSPSSSIDRAWSQTGTRRSSNPEQYNYFPLSGYNPSLYEEQAPRPLSHAQTMPPPSTQAWETHPAYHGGTPSMAARRYTPAQSPELTMSTNVPMASQPQSPVALPQRIQSFASPTAAPAQPSLYPKAQMSPFIFPQNARVARSPSTQTQVSPLAQPQQSPMPFPQFHSSPAILSQPSPLVRPQNSLYTPSPYQQPQSALQPPTPLNLQNPLSRHGSISNHSQPVPINHSQRRRQDSASSTNSITGHHPASKVPSSRHDSPVVGRRDSASRRSSVGSGTRERTHHHRRPSGLREPLPASKEQPEPSKDRDKEKKQEPDTYDHGEERR